MARGFGQHYLSLDSSSDYGAWSIAVDLKASARIGILSPTGRDYYRWIDSFLDSLDVSISKGKFYQSIGWDSALTVLDALARGPGKEQDK